MRSAPYGQSSLDVPSILSSRLLSFPGDLGNTSAYDNYVQNPLGNHSANLEVYGVLIQDFDINVDLKPASVTLFFPYLNKNVVRVQMMENRRMILAVGLDFKMNHPHGCMLQAKD
jgi:hypothetical protein